MVAASLAAPSGVPFVASLMAMSGAVTVLSWLLAS